MEWRLFSFIFLNFYFRLFGAATQLVILPPQIAWEGQIGGILMLRYSIICISGLAIFDLNEICHRFKKNIIAKSDKKNAHM